MKQHSIFERHPILCGTSLLLVVMIATLIGLEYGFRFVRDAVKGSPWVARAENVDDPELGWVLNPDKTVVVKSNACGERVVRNAPASRYLLKRAVGSNVGGTPVLFLGDSFTQGTEVSSDGMYFEWFERQGQGAYAVSAAGGGGYGTAQEYLLLHRVFGLIKPKVVFWQLTSNDVGENVFVGTDIATVQKPRPYYDMVRGTFEIRNPALILLQYSELSKYLYGELMKIERSHPFGLGSVTGWIGSRKLMQGEVERRGLETLDLLLARAMKEFPSTRFVGFNTTEAFDEEYAMIFEKRGALYIKGFAKGMTQRAQGRRIDCAPIDSHWNHEGNRVAANMLLEFANRVVASSNHQSAN